MAQPGHFRLHANFCAKSFIWMPWTYKTNPTKINRRETWILGL